MTSGWNTSELKHRKSPVPIGAGDFFFVVALSSLFFLFLFFLSSVPLCLLACFVFRPLGSRLSRSSFLLCDFLSSGILYSCGYVSSCVFACLLRHARSKFFLIFFGKPLPRMPIRTIFALFFGFLRFAENVGK